MLNQSDKSLSPQSLSLEGDLPSRPLRQLELFQPDSFLNYPTEPIEIVRAVAERIPAETFQVTSSDIARYARILFPQDNSFNDFFTAYPQNCEYIQLLQQDNRPELLLSRLKGMQLEAYNLFAAMFLRTNYACQETNPESIAGLYRRNFGRADAQSEGDSEISQDMRMISAILTAVMLPIISKNGSLFYSRFGRQMSSNSLRFQDIDEMWGLWREAHNFSQESSSEYSPEEIAEIWFDDTVATTVSSAARNWQAIGYELYELNNLDGIDKHFPRIHHTHPAIPEVSTQHGLFIQPQFTYTFPSGRYLHKLFKERGQVNGRVPSGFGLVHEYWNERLQFKARPDQMLISTGNGKPQIIIIDDKSSLLPNYTGGPDFLSLPRSAQWQIYVTHMGAVAFANSILNGKKSRSPYQQLSFDPEMLMEYDVEIWHRNTSAKIDNRLGYNMFASRNYTIPLTEIPRLNRELAVFGDILLRYKTQIRRIVSQAKNQTYDNPQLDFEKLTQIISDFNNLNGYL